MYIYIYVYIYISCLFKRGVETHIQVLYALPCHDFLTLLTSIEKLLSRARFQLPPSGTQVRRSTSFYLYSFSVVDVRFVDVMILKLIT